MFFLGRQSSPDPLDPSGPFSLWSRFLVGSWCFCVCSFNGARVCVRVFSLSLVPKGDAPKVGPKPTISGGRGPKGGGPKGGSPNPEKAETRCKDHLK